MSRTVSLTQGKVAIIDDADYERVSRFTWHAGHIKGHWYASSRLPAWSNLARRTRMHQLIIGDTHGLEVDHINGDRLDNRRENLRLATHEQNMWNHKRSRGGSSRFVGVSRERGRWRSIISRKGRTIHLGSFSRFFGYLTFRCRGAMGNSRANETIELARTQTMTRAIWILPPFLERQRASWRVLKFFARTTKTERAFWKRFGKLPRHARAFLGRFYDIDTPWDLFERICLFWNVGIPNPGAYQEIPRIVTPASLPRGRMPGPLFIHAGADNAINPMPRDHKGKRTQTPKIPHRSTNA